MSQRLGIGVVGLGAHALRGHLHALSNISKCQVVALCDPSPQAREAAGQEHPQAILYERLPQMLEDPALDAVMICSPDRFHAASLAQTISAGLHVMVEKPLADHASDLELIQQAFDEAKANGLVVSSCHPRRFDPPYVWLAENLEWLTRQLGPVLDVRLDFFYHAPSKSGLHHGLLIDHVNHEIDLLSFLLGPAGFEAWRLYDSEVRYGAAGVREDGICFSFFGSRHLNRRVYSELARVRFQRGEVSVDTERGVARVRDYDRDQDTRFQCGPTDYALRFALLNRNFVEACLGQTASYLSREQMMVNTRIGIELTEQGRFSYQP